MPMFPYSRYRYCTRFTNEDGISYLDEREPFRYSEESDNVEHVAKDGDAWWGIAHRYFQGLPRPVGLWWLLCEFQPTPVLDPTIQLVAGASIYIPSLRLVRLKVFNPERRQFH